MAICVAVLARINRASALFLRLATSRVSTPYIHHTNIVGVLIICIILLS